MNRSRAVLLPAAAGATLLVLLALPLLRLWLEASLVSHVLMQMPLLALSGWLLGAAIAPRLYKAMEQWNRCGIPGLALAVFTSLFWMLPRSVDGAVQYGGHEMLKFLTLPCVGAALALSLRRTHVLLAAILKANLVSMLGVLAWLYTAAPVRLCNSYLASDQRMLGVGMALLGCFLALNWALGLLFGPYAGRPTAEVKLVEASVQAINN
jgi:hypothetical protein